jgi:hypothetical protein
MCVNGVYSFIHIILIIFIWSGKHKFYIHFLRQLGLQLFIMTLYRVFFFKFHFIVSVEESIVNDCEQVTNRLFKFYVLHGFYGAFIIDSSAPTTN